MARYFDVHEGTMKAALFIHARLVTRARATQHYSMKSLITVASFVVFAALPLAGAIAQVATQTESSAEMGVHSLSDIQWKSGPPSLPTGAKMAVLEGDPTKDAPFVMRLQAPADYHIPPHTHPKTERVTVISGMMFLAMGDNLERSAAKTLPAGTYAFWPAGMKHAAWFNAGTVIQLHGIGPWQINYLNPADDPRNAKK
jgi:quercetin dioxygenase-like cupin family protein